MQSSSSSGSKKLARRQPYLGVHEGHDRSLGLWQLQGLDLCRLKRLESPAAQISSTQVAS